MTVAIDTNILLDILLPDLRFKDASFKLLTKYAQTDYLIISDIVYAELASQFANKSLLSKFLSDTNICLINTSADALWIAAKAWEKYTKEREQYLQCTQCGNSKLVKCCKCGAVITSRQHIIPDFLIGGHAIIEAERLLTRDRGFYRKYFLELAIESPKTGYK